MPVRSWLLFAGLPVLGVVGYFLAVNLVPQTHQHLIYWENGAVELATAALFALAGLLGILLARRCEKDTPRRYRLLYLAMGVGALFAALEEVSYGQHLFGWEASGWFAQHNIQRETNLHNLFGDSSRRMLHQIGGDGCLIAGLLLPALAMLFYRTYRPGHWTHYLVPRCELMPVVLLEVLVRLFKHSSAGESWRFVLDEFRECLWSATVLLYVVVMWRRLGPGREQAVIRVHDDESHPHQCVGSRFEGRHERGCADSMPAEYGPHARCLITSASSTTPGSPALATPWAAPAPRCPRSRRRTAPGRCG